MGRQTGCRTRALRGAPLTVRPTRCPAPPSRTAALLRPCRPPTKGGGGGCVVPGGGGTTLSPTLALSLTPLTQSSSLWLPLCLHPRLPCSTLLPRTLPCSILLPHTLPCSILLPQTLPCSIHIGREEGTGGGGVGRTPPLLLCHPPDAAPKAPENFLKAKSSCATGTEGNFCLKQWKGRRGGWGGGLAQGLGI